MLTSMTVKMGLHDHCLHEDLFLSVFLFLCCVSDLLQPYEGAGPEFLAPPAVKHPPTPAHGGLTPHLSPAMDRKRKRSSTSVE